MVGRNGLGRQTEESAEGEGVVDPLLRCAVAQLVPGLGEHRLNGDYHVVGRCACCVCLLLGVLHVDQRTYWTPVNHHIHLIEKLILSFATAGIQKDLSHAWCLAV